MQGRRYEGSSHFPCPATRWWGRNYEHMSRGWWPLDDYGTNPTHERRENRCRGNGNQRRSQSGERNESYSRGRGSTTHPAKHGNGRKRDLLDLFLESFCSNTFHNNHGTIRIHCHACRTTQMRWAFLVQLGERTFH